MKIQKSKPMLCKIEETRTCSEERRGSTDRVKYERLSVKGVIKDGIKESNSLTLATNCT